MMILPHLDDENTVRVCRAQPLQIGEPYLLYVIKFKFSLDMMIQTVSVSPLIDGCNAPYVYGGGIALTGKDIRFLHLETIQELARTAQDKAVRGVARINQLEEELHALKATFGLHSGTRLQITAGDGADMEPERAMLGHADGSVPDTGAGAEIGPEPP